MKRVVEIYNSEPNGVPNAISSMQFGGLNSIVGDQFKHLVTFSSLAPPHQSGQHGLPRPHAGRLRGGLDLPFVEACQIRRDCEGH